MNVGTPEKFTDLLLAWNKGDQTALDRLVPLVYAELRRLAHRYMRRERAGHTLQTTELVNEAYLRLVDCSRVHWRNRAHFLAVVAKLMRRVLVDLARKRKCDRHGGGMRRVSFDDAMAVTWESLADLAPFDEALEKLAQVYPRAARVVEMHYFGGLEGKEIAAVLEVSAATVSGDWKFAKLWLRRALNGEKGAVGGR